MIGISGMAVVNEGGMTGVVGWTSAGRLLLQQRVLVRWVGIKNL